MTSPDESVDLGELFCIDGVAIVTGASSGLGARFCQVLAARGVPTLAVARRRDRIEDLAHRSALIRAFTADVTDPASPERIVDAAADMGTIGVLVNNAGIGDGVQRAESQDPATFRSVIDVNLNSVFALTAAFARRVLADGGSASVVNIASVHGLVAAAPNSQAGYVASKAGLIGLTRELAGQWARDSIRVNAIAPGYFPTEMTAPMMESEASGLRYIRRNTMMGRPGTIDELDGVLLFLASAASSYVTGQVLAVDGGWTAR